MTRQLSLDRYEHDKLPDFRGKLQQAESSEDVKKSFAQVTKALLEEIMGAEAGIGLDTIALTPGEPPYFLIEERFKKTAPFHAIWDDSDLPRIIGRLAEISNNRYIRLEGHVEKHPEKASRNVKGEQDWH